MWQIKRLVFLVTLAIAFGVKGQGKDGLRDFYVKGKEPCQLRIVLQVTGHWGGAIFIEKGTIPFNIIVINDTHCRPAESIQNQVGVELNDQMKNWFLNPVFHFYQMTPEKGEWVKGKCVTSIEMGVVPEWKPCVFPNVLTNSVQIYGSFGKKVVETLGVGTYAMEAYYDTGSVTNMNIKYSGLQKSTRSLFSIKSPATIQERMYVDQQNIFDFAKQGNWVGVLENAEAALKKYPENDAAEFFLSKGEALEKLGRLEESIMAYDRYLVLRPDTRSNYMPVLIRGKVNDLKRTRNAKETVDQKTK